MFHRVDKQLGAYFDTMRQESLLDLPNRKNKAPGGYCTSFPATGRPFIFMNVVGLEDDVLTMLHEAGHAFHAFEQFNNLPYYQQMQIPMEFAEVASMSMELLAAPYLPEQEGGFYSKADTAKARIGQLEKLILFWSYMAVVDAFQHWIYENHDLARDTRNCDAKWRELYQRYIPSVDWSGLDDELMAIWYTQGHIFESPFYYIEYGLAQLGAAQVWANALKDQAKAVADYRKALALGYTVPLPQLYQTAGVKLAFDAATLGQSVELAEKTLNTLYQTIRPAS
jgi:oligoendopeptidase F